MPDLSLTWVHLNMGVSLEKGDSDFEKASVFRAPGFRYRSNWLMIQKSREQHLVMKKRKENRCQV